MTNPCKAFTSGSLSSWEVSGKMSRGKAASTSPDRLGRCSPNGVASNGYSSLSLHGDGGYQSSSYFSIDGRLLAPVHLDIDTDFQAMRQQETEDIKLLNNQFVTLIEKVRRAAEDTAQCGDEDGGREANANQSGRGLLEAFS